MCQIDHRFICPHVTYAQLDSLYVPHSYLHYIDTQNTDLFRSSTCFVVKPSKRQRCPYFHNQSLCLPLRRLMDVSCMSPLHLF